jgi:hypothetical protein
MAPQARALRPSRHRIACTRLLDRPARRRYVVRIMRTLDDRQKSGHFQRARIPLAFSGTCKDVRSDLGLHRRRALGLRKRRGGVLKDHLHQFDQLGLKNRSSGIHGRSLQKRPPPAINLSPDFSSEQYTGPAGIKILSVPAILAAMRQRSPMIYHRAGAPSIRPAARPEPVRCGR